LLALRRAEAFEQAERDALGGQSCEHALGARAYHGV
jgi:hypothetical protein